VGCAAGQDENAEGHKDPLKVQVSALAGKAKKAEPGSRNKRWRLARQKLR
jgi:hypothetical protein